MAAPTPSPPPPPAPAADADAEASLPSRVWAKYRSWPTWAQIAAAVVLLFVIVGAASGGGEDGETVAAVETTTTEADDEDDTTSTSAEATTTEAPATTASAARTEMQNSVTMIEPPDEAGYLDAIRRREPERMAEFDDAVLVAFGLKACEFSDGYISGDSPNPGDLLLEEMVSGGIDAELADRMVSDIRNAKEGTLCDTTRAEVEVDG